MKIEVNVFDPANKHLYSAFVEVENKTEHEIKTAAANFIARIVRNDVVPAPAPIPLFDVWLESVDPNFWIEPIKAVRTVTGLGLKEAKDFVQGTLPAPFLFGLTKGGCEGAREAFRDSKAVISFRPAVAK